jgi:hypothetical protein
VIEKKIDDLLQRTIHVADRWRAYDPEVAQPCNLAAGILKTLGEHDLAWDYLTSRFATGEEHAYLWGEGNTLSIQGHFELAERAFATESVANPQNGIVVWNRIANLRHAGQTEQADALLKELARMKNPEPSWINGRALWQLER